MNLSELKNKINAAIEEYAADAATNAVQNLSFGVIYNESEDVDIEAITFRMAQALYRVARYPDGPTIKALKGYLIEGKDFRDEELKGRFIEYVNEAIIIKD